MFRSIAVSFGLLLALALPASTPAKAVKGTSIASADGKLTCYATIPAEGRGILCSAPSTGRREGMTRFIGLRPTGRSYLRVRSDYGGYNAPSKVIRSGDRWTWHGIECALGAAGLACTNPDGHGFVMSARKLDRF